MGVYIWVGGEGLSLHVFDNCTDNRRVRRDATLEVVRDDGEVCGCGVLVCERVVFGCLEDRFEGRLGLLREEFEEGLAVFEVS